MTADKKAAEAAKTVQEIKKGIENAEIIPGFQEKFSVSKEFFSTIQGYFSAINTASTYYQLIAAIVSILLIYLLTSAVFKKISLLRAAPEEGARNFTLKKIIFHGRNLIPPLILLISVFPIVAQLCQIYLGDAFIIKAFSRVTIVWILWETLRSFVPGSVLRILGQWMLAPAACLQLFGLFKPFVEFLDSFKYEIGSLKISLYTMVSGVFIVALVVIFGRFISETIALKIRGKKNMTASVQELIIKLFDIGLYLLLALLALNILGIDFTALAVFGGAIGVGLGFGLQKIASNFISGVIMLMEGSVSIGNLVELDNGMTGHIRKLGARAVVMETFDGREIMIPNEDFITSRVANFTYSTVYSRIEVPFGVTYSCDPHFVKKTVLEEIRKYGFSSKREGMEPNIFVQSFGDNSIHFLVTFWLDDVNIGRWKALSDALLIIWDTLKKHNIEIPFPQREVHIRTGAPASAAVDLSKQASLSAVVTDPTVTMITEPKGA